MCSNYSHLIQCTGNQSKYIREALFNTYNQGINISSNKMSYSKIK